MDLSLYSSVGGLGFGLFFGFLSGLVPSLHINQIVPLISGILDSTTLYFAILFGSILFVCLSYIPAYFFLVPSDSNYVSVLPGQDYFIKGRAYSALVNTLVSILISTVISLPFVFILYFYSSKIISLYKYLISPVLILSLGFLLVKKTRNIFSVLVVLLSCGLGYICLRTETVSNPLFVLVGGLFGLSSAMSLFYFKSEWVKQGSKVELGAGIWKNGIYSNILGLLVTFFPGLGSGFAAFLGEQLKLFKEKINYIQAIGGISISVLIFSFMNIYFTGKARTGVAYYLPLQIPWYYTYILGILFVFISVFITYKVGKLFVGVGNKIGNKIKYAVPIILVVLAAITTNWFGLFIFILCGLTGFICIITGNPRTIMMSSIIFPVLLFFI
jgi:TctA family transporter